MAPGRGDVDALLDFVALSLRIAYLLESRGTHDDALDMLIATDLFSAIAEGRVDRVFRRWRRPSVKTGGTLTTAHGALSIDVVEAIQDADLGADDAAGAGFDSLEDLRLAIGEMPEGQLYRIRLHYIGADPRIALRERKSLDDLTELDEALAKLDRGGPWTEATLSLIAKHPGLVAQTLADWLGIDRDRLKARVRQLKGLGLTESLDVGYRISPRGKALLARRKAATASA